MVQVYKKKRGEGVIKNSRGSVTLMGVILISLMLMSIGLVMNRVRAQYNLAQLRRESGSQYELAQAGIELFVGRANQLLEENQYRISEKIHEDLTRQIAEEPSIVRYDEGSGYYEINPLWVRLKVMQLVQEICLETYYEKRGSMSYRYEIKGMQYHVKGERQVAAHQSELKFIPYLNGINQTSLLAKELVDYNQLKQLKDVKEYSDIQLKSEYQRITQNPDHKKSIKNLMGIKVRVMTKDEKQLTFSQEEVMAQINIVNLDKINCHIVPKRVWGDGIQEEEVLFDLVMSYFPIKMGIKSLRVDKK